MGEGGDKKPQSDAIKSRNEWIAGSTAGFVCKLIEYPLDTVKVQIQTQKAGSVQMGPLAMLKQTIKKDGFFGLYRGIPSPLVGSMVENSVLFTSYGFATRLIHNGDPETLPFHKKLLAGGFSGACVATVLTPVELIKCKMQTQNDTAVRYANSAACVKDTLSKGGIRAFFHGHVGTLCREVPGNAAWFGGYELAVVALTPPGGQRSDVSPLGLMAAGACGGMSYWAVPFPFDVVKSKIQTGTHGMPAGSRVNVLTVLQHVFKTEGIKGLYRGCALTVGRAAPSNAVLFMVYELTIRLLNGDPLMGK